MRTTSEAAVGIGPSTTDDRFAARFLSGRELYGDDFSPAEIDAWFADEEHGFAELYGSDRATHAYGYTALNAHFGFARLPAGRRFAHVLGFGSNFGDELLPILGRADRVTLLDASERYVVDDIQGVPVRYLMAEPSGRIALDAGSVDLITCFGVLHHVPNVSAVLAEMGRVLAPGGILLLREPTTSMGDWRQARRGLTRRERGLPRDLFRTFVERGGMTIEHAAPCYFPPWVRLCAALGFATFNSAAATRIDAALSTLFDRFWTYHRTTLAARFAPANLFVMARRATRAR